MFLIFLIGSAFAATQNKDRPVHKKINHLKKSAPQMVDMYFRVAMPDPNNPAHANGPKEPENRRNRVADRLSAKLTSLANVVEKAVEHECVFVAAGRGALERFVQGNFKMAARQVLKNYLRLRENLHSDTKQCRQHKNKITRKVKRYDNNLRQKYCAKVYHEEWCDHEYEYTLDQRVTEKNPYDPLKNE
jgi:hypothetical protein